MRQIEVHSFEAEGLKKVYDNGSWFIGMKNYKPANDLANLDCLERHNETDEIFVLLEGGCVLLTAEETSSGLAFEALSMESHRVYVIPKGLWHTTITGKDSKLVLVEASGTSEKNSDVLKLSKDDAAKGAKATRAAGWNR